MGYSGHISFAGAQNVKAAGSRKAELEMEVRGRALCPGKGLEYSSAQEVPWVQFLIQGQHPRHSAPLNCILITERKRQKLPVEVPQSHSPQLLAECPLRM